MQHSYLNLSLRKPLSNRNQSIDLHSNSMDWFLYDIGLRHERVKLLSFEQQEFANYHNAQVYIVFENRLKNQPSRDVLRKRQGLI